MSQQQSFKAPSVYTASVSNPIATGTCFLALYARNGVTLNSNGEVTQWNDLSGNGRNFTTRPSGTAPLLNSQKGELTFRGGTDGLALASQTLPTDTTIIIVGRPLARSFFGTFFGSAGATASSIRFALYSNGGAEDLTALGLQSGNLYAANGNPSDLIAGGATPQNSLPNQVFVIRISGTTYQHWRGHQLIFSGTSPTTYTPTSNGIGIGYNFGVGQALNCAIKFVGIWSGLSDTDRQSIVSSLLLPEEQWNIPTTNYPIEGQFATTTQLNTQISSLRNEIGMIGSPFNNTSAANAAAVITVAAPGAGLALQLNQLTFSYSGAPTGGLLTIQQGISTIHRISITASGAGPVVAGIKLAANTSLTITLAAGGAGVIGDINASVSTVTA